MENEGCKSSRCGEERSLTSPARLTESVPALATQRIAVATAAVWATVYGYLTVLLRGQPLANRLPKSSRCRPVPRLLLLCPSDGRLPDDIGQLHPRLTPTGRAQSFLASVAGARSRPFGAHSVFELQPAEGTDDDTLLLAMESVSSLRTMHVVAEAMARSERNLPRLDTRRLVRQFIRALREMVDRDPALRCWIKVVVYDPSQDTDKSFLPALLRAATEDTERPCGSVSPPPSPPGAPLPVGVGVYLAWSFFHGYLELVAGRRDVAGELLALQQALRLPLPVRKLVLLCPLAAGWTDTDADDLPALDSQLQPVQDVDGVETGVPALAGRSYGSFSIYRSRQEGSGCFALELATPLRTLSLGVASEDVSPELYCSEARNFTDELQTLLREHPHVGAHFAVLKIGDLTKIHCELANLA